MLEPEVESRPWDEQLALDDESYRDQLAYLLERSAFYREKLGLASAAEAGGLADIGSLPLADGRFHLRLGLTDESGERLYHWLDDALVFVVYPGGDERGVVRFEGRWILEEKRATR